MLLYLVYPGLLVYYLFDSLGVTINMSILAHRIASAWKSAAEECGPLIYLPKGDRETDGKWQPRFGADQMKFKNSHQMRGIRIYTTLYNQHLQTECIEIAAFKANSHIRGK